MKKIGLIASMLIGAMALSSKCSAGSKDAELMPAISVYAKQVLEDNGLQTKLFLTFLFPAGSEKISFALSDESIHRLVRAQSWRALNSRSEIPITLN
ncbi:MAG: hypothetical protein ACK4E7_06925 [Permianibacter sp.]